MKKPRYYVDTYDPEKEKFTPQRGVRRGPYTLFGLRTALRKLRDMGYQADRDDPSIYVSRKPKPCHVNCVLVNGVWVAINNEWGEKCIREPLFEGME